MLFKKILVLVIAVVAMSSAFAAEKAREFSVDGTYISASDQPSSFSMLNVSLGQFMTPQLVIVTALSTLNNYGYTATSIGLGGKYYFMDGLRGDLVPFAGVGIALRQSGNSSSTQYDLNGGVAYFLSDITTLDAKAKVMSYNQPDSGHSTMTVLSVGLTQRF